MLSLRRAIIGTLEVPRYTHVVVLSRALIITSLCERNDDVMRPGQLHLALPYRKCHRHLSPHNDGLAHAHQINFFHTVIRMI